MNVQTTSQTFTELGWFMCGAPLVILFGVYALLAMIGPKK